MTEDAQNTKYAKDMPSEQQATAHSSGKKNILKQTLIGAGIGATGGIAAGFLNNSHPKDSLSPYIYKGNHSEGNDSTFPLFTVSMPDSPSLTALGVAMDHISSLSDIKVSQDRVKGYLRSSQENAKHLLTGKGYENWALPNAPQGVSNAYRNLHRKNLKWDLGFTTVVGTAIGAASGFYLARRHNRKIDKEHAEGPQEWQDKVKSENSGVSSQHSPAVSK